MFLNVMIGVVALTVVMCGLMGILLFAQSRLVQRGKVKILINDDEEKSPEVDAGGTLLSVLSNHGVFLPSACGGGGTCAMCKCQVLEGGGDILPTELAHVTRSEAKEHWRLACQVKVKQDIDYVIMVNKPPDEFTVWRSQQCWCLINLPILKLQESQHPIDHQTPESSGH